MTASRDALWAGHREKWAQLLEGHPLRYLFLEVTRRCNLSCAYCGSECTPDALASELDVAEWIGVVRQIAEDFEPARIMVAVTGGEPLIKPGIFDLFAELARLGFPYGIVSNGFRIGAEVAERLVQVGIGSISLSMDAPGDLNDQLRGEGATARVEAAVGNLQRAGFAGKLEIISTITTPVVPLLDAMRRRVAELRVPAWRIAPVMPIGRAAARPDLVPGPTEVRAILEYVRSARRDQLLPRAEFCEEGFVGNRFEGVVRPYLTQCRAGVTTGGIRCHGAIGACPELGDAFLQGDIRTERFRDVWNTRYEVFRNREWTRKGRCATCDHFPNCQGGSLHLYATPEADLLRCLYWMAREAEAPG